VCENAEIASHFSDLTAIIRKSRISYYAYEIRYNIEFEPARELYQGFGLILEAFSYRYYYKTWVKGQRNRRHKLVSFYAE